MGNSQSKEYTLCMYDVRGIQEYVFRTNKVKHVIGASKLVENFYLRGIEEISNNIWGDSSSAYITDWCCSEELERPELLIGPNNPHIKMEVLYIGGGNALIVFRNEKSALDENLETSVLFNRKFSRWILDTTYSLQLAIAKVDTNLENYSQDYYRLIEEMQRVKTNMQLSVPFTGFPIVAREGSSGKALSNRYDRATNKPISKETALKLASLENEGASEGKHLDDLVTLKGEDSWLAFVHIDGNSMGQKIAQAMLNTQNDPYSKAVQTIRSLSYSISNGFESTYENMKTALRRINEQDQLIRDIILAGDDITFVCNANIAIPLVKFFLEQVGTKSRKRIS